MLATVEVVLENTTPAFDKPYSYLVSEGYQQIALPGARVRVPFGRGNRKRTGLIISKGSVKEAKGFKYIEKVIDTPPLLDDEGMVILRYLKEFTFSTWFDALRVLIPAGLTVIPKISYRPGKIDNTKQYDEQSMEILNYITKRPKGIRENTLYANLSIKEDNLALQQLIKEGAIVKSQQLGRKILDDKVTMVEVIGEPTTDLTPLQQEVYDFLRYESPISLREATYYTGASRSVLDALKTKKAVEFYQEIKPRGDYAYAQAEETEETVLSQPQQQAYENIRERLGKESVTMLYGITGSGKTQVFVKLVEDVVAKGESAIVMVPEISLTSQTVVLLQKLFGNKVAVLHSGLSLGERTDEWKRIQQGDATVVVGTRSAVFAPVKKLGLIVIDEEQEHTYKSDQSPRYHARDVAKLRCRYHNVPLVLSSATPSVESYYFATEGRYHLEVLPDRFGEAELPDVEVVDMSASVNISSSVWLSQVLIDELYYNLEHKEQSILLLNRRGYSTVIKCSSCGEVAQCPHCSVAMTYHTANGHLVCHYCGYMEKPSNACGACGSEFIRYSGIGTQKLEEDIKALFPQARILRMDTDTTTGRDSHETMFDSFRNTEYDILIGTQMVAKGLNFPKVTLVGVVNADQSLYANDFRGYERTFSLLTQVVGRSGRGEHPGRALVQTYTPEHPIINLASKQDYPSFYRSEIQNRRLHLYPPFCTMSGIGFVGKNLRQVETWAIKFAHQFQKLAKSDYPDIPIRMLGPSPSQVLKVAEKYRYKLIIKCNNNSKTREFFSRMLDWFYKNCKDVSIFIDMYYERM